MYKTALVVKGKLALAQYSICLGAGVPVTNCAGGGQVVGRAGPPPDTVLDIISPQGPRLLCSHMHFSTLHN